MGTKFFLSRILAASIIASRAQTPAPNEITYRDNILRVSEAEQIAFVRSVLDQCIPPGDTLTLLLLNRSSLALPLIERKIEEVLKLPRNPVCATGRQIDPDGFINLAAQTLVYAGNEQALREVGKLLKLDANRFDELVQLTLFGSEQEFG